MSTEQKKARPKGRPSKYKKEYCEMLVSAAEQGEDITGFACDIRVHKDTLYEWAKHHKEFSDAMKLARQMSERWFRKLGRAGMAGKIKGFNASAWIFWMKAQHNWDEAGQMNDQEEVGLEFV